MIYLLLILQVALAFNSSYDSYKMFKFNERPLYSSLYHNDNEIFDRNKCKTCCRVIFVSDYNFQLKRQFREKDDEDGFIRYVMDMEFDDLRNVRDPNNYNNFYNEYKNYEQNIILRPLDSGNPLQYFEFGEFNMYKPYLIPKRVFDIQGGVKEGRSLILYMNKWGMEDDNGVKNQQFRYVHNYTGLNYYDSLWKNYPGHFFLPNTTKLMLCFSAEDVEWGNRIYKNTGNKDLTPLWHNETDINERVEKVKNDYIGVEDLEKAYQIVSRNCNKYDAKQLFIPVFV